MLSEPIVLAIIAAVSGASGLFTLIRAWMDHKEHKAARVEDADERLVSRLEKRLNQAEERIECLERQGRKDSAYILKLSTTLAKAGLDVPAADQA